MNIYVKPICEEYCKSVTVLDGDELEVVVAGQYFTELYSRVMIHGYCCKTIMSNSHDDVHIATFVPVGERDFDMFDDLFDNGHEDDSSDWWKFQD